MVEDGVVVFRDDGWCGWMSFGGENMENGVEWCGCNREDDF